MKIFTFSGFAGNGKTTLIKHCVKTFKNYNILIHNETVRLIDKIFSIDNFKEAQKNILIGEICSWNLLIQLNNCKNLIIFSDRFILDNVFYGIIRGVYDEEMIYKVLNIFTDKEKNKNIHIILLKSINREIIKEILKDELRLKAFKSVENFEKMQNKFYEIYKKYENYLICKGFNIIYFNSPSILSEETERIIHYIKYKII